LSNKADNTIKHPLELGEATRLIREIACNDQAKRTIVGHADDRKAFRCLGDISIDMVLKDGEVVDRRFEKNSWRYKVELADKYGKLYVVTAIPKKDRLVIITTFSD